MDTREVTIKNKWGLHTKTAFALAREAMAFECGLTVEKNGKTADAKRIDELLLLGAASGDSIQICAAGPDEKEALKTLVKLVESNFGEE